MARWTWLLGDDESEVRASVPDRTPKLTKANQKSHRAHRKNADKHIIRAARSKWNLHADAT